MVGVLKLGLAYGIAEYLHAMANVLHIVSSPVSPSWALYYISFNDPPYPILFPALEKVVLAGGVLLLFGLFEAALSAAMGIFMATIPSVNKTVQYRIGICLRAIPVALCLGIFIISSAGNSSLFYDSHINPWSRPNGDVIADNAMSWLRVVETIQVAVSTQIDGGTLASANLLRVPDWSTRFFYVVRALLNVALGLGLLALSTRLFLWLAGRLTRRNEMVGGATS